MTILLSTTLPEPPSEILPALHHQCRIWQIQMWHFTGRQPAVTVLAGRALFRDVYLARYGEYADERLTAYVCGDVRVILWRALRDRAVLIGGEGVESLMR